jgi:adenylate cyclase
MKINLMSATVRYLGVLSIILFCTVSMFLSFIERDIEDPRIKNLIKYAPFFENRFLDYRLNNQIKDRKIDKDVVLVAIDDESIKQVGIWPFPRTVYATFLEVLNKAGGKVAVFDVLFPEKSLSCDLGENSPDNIFARSIATFQSTAGNKVVLPYSLADHPSQAYAEMPEDLYNFIMDTQQAGEVGLESAKVSKETYPIAQLRQSEPALAHLNHREDSDGVFRHYHVAANVDSLYLPSLGLTGYQNISGDNTKLIINLDGSASLNTKNGEIPVNPRGEIKIRYHGGIGKFAAISLNELIKPNPDYNKLREVLGGKVVFLGSTAVGAHDLRNTPVDAKLPGVYFHMNLVHMLQNGYFFQKIEDSIYYSLIFLAIGTLILLVLQRFDNPLLDLAGVITVFFGTYYIDQVFFVPEGYEIRLFFTLNSFVLQYVWDTFLNFYQSNKDKKRIKGAFSSYVSPAVVNEMLKNPENLKVGGQKIDITCMFSDVRDFTTISETLSAEELATCLNMYMGKMTELVFEYSGTLDKYIGDAVVALWGAPIPMENHPELAVESAIKQIEAIPAINEEFKRLGYPEFKVGIGLNSGECSVGNMGSDIVFSYTALGDNMNLGARIEGMCKPYGCQIIISEYTFAKLDKDKFTCRPLDKVRVKGKTKPVELYEVFHSGHPYLENVNDYHRYIEGYRLFHAKKFKEALTIFSTLNETYGDIPTQRLKGYCEEYIANPPGPEWDGVITFKTK